MTATATRDQIVRDSTWESDDGLRVVVLHVHGDDVMTRVVEGPSSSGTWKAMTVEMILKFYRLITPTTPPATCTGTVYTYSADSNDGSRRADTCGKTRPCAWHDKKMPIAVELQLHGWHLLIDLLANAIARVHDRDTEVGRAAADVERKTYSIVRDAIIAQITREPATPLYPHDCEECIYLGVHHSEDGGQYDLYICLQGGASPTVIARYGADHRHTSGLTAAPSGLLAEAQRSALRRATFRLCHKKG